MSSNKLLTESSFLKTPYEILNFNFKKSRKDIEKQMNTVMTTIINLKNTPEPSREEVSEKIQESANKLKNLKRRLNEQYVNQTSIYENIKKRIHHLNMAHLEVNERSIKESSFLKTKINRLIVEYFYLNEKYKESEELSKVLNIETFCSCQQQLIKHLAQIVHSLQNKNMCLIKRWCNENKSKLIKLKSDLEFKILMQEFVELIRQGKMTEAIQIIRQNIHNPPSSQESFQQLMGCLVFHQSKINKYQNYFSLDRWNDLIKIFKQTCFKVYKINFESNLQKILSFGISAVKTMCCNKKITQNKNICPICQINFNEVALKIPYVNTSRSTLICRISKQQMDDEKNPPMMLPNGQIYGKKGLDSMQKNGHYTCPITLTTYEIALAKRVFLFI